MPIPKALHADEAACGTVPMPATKPTRGFRAQIVVGGLLVGGTELIRHHEIPALIALANAALLADDPRKFTEDSVDLIREAFISERWESLYDEEETGKLHHVADVLESYLPPTADAGTPP